MSNFGPAGNATFTDSNGVERSSYGAMSSILFDEDRERASSQLTLQYAPSDNLSFNLNYNLFELKNDHINSAMFAIVGFGQMQGDSVVENANGIVTQATSLALGAGLAPLFNNAVLRKPDMQTDALNFTVEYEADTWSADFVIGKSDAKGETLQSSTWWGDITNTENSSFSFDVAGPLELIPTNPAYLDSHSNFDLFQEFTYINYIRENEIDYAQADFTFLLESDLVTSIQAGLKYQQQAFSSQGNYQDLDLAAAMAEGLSLADFNGGFVSSLHSAEGRAGSMSSFPVASRDIWRYAEANKPSSISVRDAFSIEEDITAAYVKANFSGEGFRGNVGLRIVDTDILSVGEISGMVYLSRIFLLLLDNSTQIVQRKKMRPIRYFIWGSMPGPSLGFCYVDILAKRSAGIMALDWQGSSCSLECYSSILYKRYLEI